MTFVGFDLHKRHITACALDASGVVVTEIRQLTTTLATVLATVLTTTLAPVLATVLEWLAALPAPITIAMEATLYWAWLAARLEQAGHRAHVADAHQVRLIWHARAKPDTVDSRTLAELLRTNLLPTIWVPDLETRRRRQLLRGRAFLVRERTRIKNRIHGHLTAENQRFARSDLYGKAGRVWREAVALSTVVAAETQRRLHLHDVLTKEIARLDDQVKCAARCDPAAQRLATIPGVGVFGALFLHAEIGPIERFRSSHQLAAYAGLVPTTRSSGGKTTHGPLAKMSDHWLEWILVEIVQTLKLAPGPVGAYYRHPLRAKGKPKATSAAARLYDEGIATPLRLTHGVRHPGNIELAPRSECVQTLQRARYQGSGRVQCGHWRGSSLASLCRLGGRVRAAVNENRRTSERRRRAGRSGGVSRIAVQRPGLRATLWRRAPCWPRTQRAR